MNPLDICRTQRGMGAFVDLALLDPSLGKRASLRLNARGQVCHSLLFLLLLLLEGDVIFVEFLGFFLGRFKRLLLATLLTAHVLI